MISLKVSQPVIDFFNAYKKFFIVTIVLLLICITSWVTSLFPRKDLVDQILAQQEAQTKAQYSQKIKDQQIIIDELNKQLKDSNEAIFKINKNIETLKKKKEVINVPKNDEELYNRFIDAGFTPIKR